MNFSPMWPIWAEDICVPIAEANEAWQEYIDCMDLRRTLDAINNAYEAAAMELFPDE